MPFSLINNSGEKLQKLNQNRNITKTRGLKFNYTDLKLSRNILATIMDV